ncbi:hypothetical protein [Cerasicoccus arenae]|uniref:Uncharacterized protein n=1 Tax=Cerasicoccus arenae TaxID=424488 RepID=A0A8J3GE96_9BACT|nr:hypothetical protein [Cerasicoccus arenae]MBK1858225.1 hypothetical protein [Cerasicoccus arenae]GHC02010.1 hypothetical protein GCM10007047_18120 [Cerasicoccus arenae]
MSQDADDNKIDKAVTGRTVPDAVVEITLSIIKALGPAAYIVIIGVILFAAYYYGNQQSQRELDTAKKSLNEQAQQFESVRSQFFAGLGEIGTSQIDSIRQTMALGEQINAREKAISIEANNVAQINSMNSKLESDRIAFLAKIKEQSEDIINMNSLIDELKKSLDSERKLREEYYEQLVDLANSYNEQPDDDLNGYFKLQPTDKNILLSYLAPSESEAISIINGILKSDDSDGLIRLRELRGLGYDVLVKAIEATPDNLEWGVAKINKYKPEKVFFIGESDSHSIKNIGIFDLLGNTISEVRFIDEIRIMHVASGSDTFYLEEIVVLFEDDDAIAMNFYSATDNSSLSITEIIRTVLETGSETFTIKSIDGSNSIYLSKIINFSSPEEIKEIINERKYKQDFYLLNYFEIDLKMMNLIYKYSNPVPPNSEDAVRFLEELFNACGRGDTDAFINLTYYQPNRAWGEFGYAIAYDTIKNELTQFTEVMVGNGQLEVYMFQAKYSTKYDNEFIRFYIYRKKLSSDKFKISDPSQVYDLSLDNPFEL